MTGRELLNQKLMDLGASKQQLNSKVIDMVLKTLSDEESLEPVKLLEEKLRKLESELCNEKNEYYKLSSKLTERENKLWREERKLKEQQEQIESLDEKIEFYESLQKKLETPEARDKMRLARFFLDNAPEARNVYQETEHIKALGSILGSGKSAQLMNEEGDDND